jgi:hypothetical protein
MDLFIRSRAVAGGNGRRQTVNLAYQEFYRG